MNERIHYTHCPVCHSTEIISVLQVKDYSVSGELFEVVECKSCTLRFTQDVPGVEAITPYYKSENYISHTNTSSGVINKLYHFVRNKTLQAKRKLIERETGLQQGILLDAGSGIGSFVNEMNLHGWATTGLEPDGDARKVAADIYNIILEDSSAFHELPAAQYDAITLWHVLEHVHDLQDYIQQLKKLLKEKGKLFIAVPNYTAYEAKKYNNYWAAYDVPRHLYHFSPKAMQVLLERNGMKLLKYKRMPYDSFYISLLSSKYKNGKTNWASAFVNGLFSNLKALGEKKKSSSIIYVIEK